LVRTRTETTTRTEVTDLEGRAVVVGDGVDGEMGVDEAHLVLEALRGISTPLGDEDYMSGVRCPV
jgi:hypothetical protein